MVYLSALPLCKWCYNKPPRIAQIFITIYKVCMCLPYNAIINITIPVKTEMGQPFKWWHFRTICAKVNGY